jgi:hypothetical protein
MNRSGADLAPRSAQAERECSLSAAELAVSAVVMR